MGSPRRLPLRSPAAPAHQTRRARSPDPGGGIRAPGRVPRAFVVVCDAPEVGRNPRRDDLVTGFPEKNFANQGLRLGVRVVLDTYMCKKCVAKPGRAVFGARRGFRNAILRGAMVAMDEHGIHEEASSNDTQTRCDVSTVGDPQ